MARGRCLSDSELSEIVNKRMVENPAQSIRELVKDYGTSDARLKRLKQEGKISKLPIKLSCSITGKMGAAVHKKNRTGWHRQNDLSWENRVRTIGIQV